MGSWVFRRWDALGITQKELAIAMENDMKQPRGIESFRPLFYAVVILWAGVIALAELTIWYF